MLISLFVVTLSFGGEPDKIIPLDEKTPEEIEFVITSPDKKPVIKILKPDLEKISETIIDKDLFPLLDVWEIRPAVHSLLSDTASLLQSRKIPIVWKKASDPYNYGRFITECAASASAVGAADIKNWKIMVVNSRGKNMLKYEGQGKAPEQIDIKEEDIKK
ncbi:hypothetical protein FP828_08745, partial [bacterium]|nr:hypothetical protein [bacterium]